MNKQTAKLWNEYATKVRKENTKMWKDHHGVQDKQRKEEDAIYEVKLSAYREGRKVYMEKQIEWEKSGFLNKVFTDTPSIPWKYNSLAAPRNMSFYIL